LRSLKSAAHPERFVYDAHIASLILGMTLTAARRGIYPQRLELRHLEQTTIGSIIV
jgi:hypothetical protein